MLHKLIATSLLSLRAIAIPLFDQSLQSSQQVLPNHADAQSTKNAAEVREELKKAEIIPTVVDDFKPALSLTVAWPNQTSNLGNTLDPDDLQHRPNAYINTFPHSGLNIFSSHKKKYPDIVLTLTDPDAPSRDDPKWSEFCHWIVVARNLKDVSEIVEYKPPGPPPETGKHRYVFLAWIAANETKQHLVLQKPAGRKHWGYDPDEDGEAGRVGVRKWAGEHGLMPVAANFIYAQNEKQ